MGFNDPGSCFTTKGYDIEVEACEMQMTGHQFASAEVTGTQVTQRFPV